MPSSKRPYFNYLNEVHCFFFSPRYDPDTMCPVFVADVLSFLFSVISYARTNAVLCGASNTKRQLDPRSHDPEQRLRFQLVPQSGIHRRRSKRIPEKSGPIPDEDVFPKVKEKRE